MHFFAMVLVGVKGKLRELDAVSLDFFQHSFEARASASSGIFSFEFFFLEHNNNKNPFSRAEGMRVSQTIYCSLLFLCAKSNFI